MAFSLHRCLLILCCACFVGGAARAVEPEVVIVSTDYSAAYQEATNALSDVLVSGGLARKEIEELTLVEWSGKTPQRSRLVVALGSQACATLTKVKTQQPLLCALLPRQSFERILRDNALSASAQLSALYLNQPVSRQLDLVRLALPHVRRVGVLLGPESRGGEKRLEAGVTARGLQLVSAVLGPDEPIFNDLRKILNESDVLLALADPQVYNATSIQNILLASYRMRVPMLAFSPAYVRAGALLALYSTPAQIGQQLGGVVRSVLQGRALGSPDYPQNFTISVNENVARSLGLNLNAEELTLRLQRLERRP